MELLIAEDSYLVTKVTLAAAYAGVELKVTRGVTLQALQQVDSSAKGMVLKTASGTAITQHVAMLRHIAETVPAKQLAGASSFDASQVDQWLDFSWNELGALEVVGWLAGCHARGLTRCSPHTLTLNRGAGASAVGAPV
jgi:hypothetical protein